MPGTDDRFVRSLNRWWSRQLEASDGSSVPAPATGGEPADGVPAATGYHGAGTAEPAPGWRRGRSVEALAAELRRDVQFELAQTRFLHRRPDPAASAAAVGELVPPPGPADREILAEAILRAGSAARRVRVTTAAGALLTVFALVLRNILRGR
jgi:hypothetical protein